MPNDIVGTRVVRGPNWEWGNQDGGEGCLGTVIETKLPQLKTDNENEKPKIVNVVWDIGTMAEYRVGFNSAFDLRVVDNSAAGIIHPDVLCDGCRIKGIAGIIWQCNDCPSRLCTTCFTNEKHESSHVSFKRYDGPSSHPVEVRWDPSKPKLILRGMFPGAQVKRGNSWSYNDEDGGDGVVGEVVAIVNPSERTVGKIRVQWPNNQTHYYRLGSKGKVDLEGVQVVANGRYQPHMLPILGLDSEQKESGVHYTNLSVGDNVKVSVDFELLRELQDDYERPSQEMMKCLEKVGTVQRVTERGVFVFYDDSETKFRFNPLAISRTTPYSVGEFVCIRQDDRIFQQMQLEFGRTTANWLKSQTGRITKFSEDGRQVDVKIYISYGKFQVETLNIDWVEAVELKPQIKNKMENLGLSLSSFIVEAAAEGQVSVLKELLGKYGVEVDAKDVCGRSPLHMACRRGQLVVVQMLLEYKASVELEDNEGNRAVHHAVEANQSEILELLIKEGSARLDFTNKKQLTALHLSVNKSFPECARVLVKNHCDVNKQDAFGDTPLHMALLNRKGSSQNQVPEIVDIIVSSTRVDLNIQNELGSNVLHLAVATENIGAVKYLLNSIKDKNQTQSEKSALTALLEAKTKFQGFTPLLLAISRSFYGIIEILVEAGSDLSAVDREGNSSIFLAALLIKRQECRQTRCELPRKETSPNIYEIFEDINRGEQDPAIQKYLSAVAIIGYLIRRGCNWRSQKTKVAKVIEENIIQLLDSFRQPGHPNQRDDVDMSFTQSTNSDQRFRTATVNTSYSSNDQIFLLESDFSRNVSREIKLLRNITIDASEEMSSNHEHPSNCIQYFQEYPYKMKRFSLRSDTPSSGSSQNSSNDRQNEVEEIYHRFQNPLGLSKDPDVTVTEDETCSMAKLAQNYCWKMEVRQEYRGANRTYVKDGLGNTYSQKKGNEVFQCTANVDQNGKKKKCRATVKREYNSQTSEPTFRLLTQHEPHWPKRRLLDGQSSSSCSHLTTLQLIETRNKSDKNGQTILHYQPYKRPRIDSKIRNYSSLVT